MAKRLEPHGVGRMMNPSAEGPTCEGRVELVTVNNRFQVVIPHAIRELAHIDVGDLLEAAIENGKITFTPKSEADRQLAEALADVREGRTHGPYGTAAEAMAALTKRVGKPKASRS